MGADDVSVDGGVVEAGPDEYVLTAAGLDERRGDGEIEWFRTDGAFHPDCVWCSCERHRCAAFCGVLRGSRRRTGPRCHLHAWCGVTGARACDERVR